MSDMLRTLFSAVAECTCEAPVLYLLLKDPLTPAVAKQRMTPVLQATQQQSIVLFCRLFL